MSATSGSPVLDRDRVRAWQRPRGPALMRQRWERLAFLHWPVEPAAIAPLLPAGLEVDTWDGAAYVGLVPFTITRARPSGLPPLPGLSSFHELNFRTYVHRGGAEPGVWFFSLDAASRAAVALARLAYKLPYHHARMALAEDSAGVVSFESHRIDPPSTRFACAYAAEARAHPARVGTLPFFLIERYLLYSWDGRRLRTARVWHRPYPIQPARVEELEQDLTARANLSLEGRPPLAHYCHELDVRIYRPRRVPI
ncbi:MAG TPA: DUF2071 domain-containing protein [Polyangia bacterium]|nr:DUF2071 domain-containing protein [Polyangia bacterium]